MLMNVQDRCAIDIAAAVLLEPMGEQNLSTEQAMSRYFAVNTTHPSLRCLPPLPE